MSSNSPIIPSGRYKGLHFGELVEQDERYARRLCRKPGLKRAYPVIYEGIKHLLDIYGTYREVGLEPPHYSKIMP